MGREEDLAKLVRKVEYCKSNSKGRFIFVVGETGVGKSALLDHLSSVLGGLNYLTTLQCTCERTQQTPYFPLVKAIAKYMDSASSHGSRLRLQSTLSAAFGEAISLVPGLGGAGALVDKVTSFRASGYLPAFVNYESRVTIAFSKFLLAFSDKKPTAVLIDDLQWADPETVGLLHYLGELIDSRPLLIIATVRAEFLAETTTETAARALVSGLLAKGLGERFDLRRLPRVDMDPLVRRFVGTHALSGGDLGLLYEETEGNPFFLRELLLLLMNRGDLQVKDGRLVAVGPLEREIVPASIRDAVAERIRKLPAEFRRTLDAAAVVGSVFDSSVVSEVVAGKQYEVLERLRDLEKIYAMVERLNGLHRFYHVKIQETLYQELPPSLRRVYHLAVANVLISKGVNDLHEIAADHYRDGGDYEKARRFYSLAVSNLIAAENWRSAERVTSKALDLHGDCLGPEGLINLANLRFLRARARLHLGDYVEARADSESVGTSPTVSARTRTDAAHMEGRCCYFLGLKEPCLKAYGRSLDEATAENDWRMMFRNHLSLAAACDLFGDYRGMEEHYHLAEQIATERADPLSRAEVLMKYGMIVMDEPPRVIPRIEEALRLYTDAADARGVAACHLNLGNEYFYQKDTGAARLHYEKCLSTIQDSEGVEQCYPLNNLAMVHQIVGELQEARRVLGEALACHLTEYHRIFILNNLANTYRMLGSHNEAVSILEQVLPSVEKDPDPVTPETTYYNLGMAYFYARRFLDAAAWIEKSFSTRTKSNAALNRGKRFRGLERAYAALGEITKAEFCRRKADELLESDVSDVWYYKDLDWEVADLAFYE